MPNPQIGLNFTFGYRPFQSVAATSYTTVATVTSISPAKYSWDKPDATLLTSTQKVYVRGLADIEVGVGLLIELGDTAGIAFKAAMVNSAQSNYDFIITAPDGSTDAFSGFCSDWSPGEIVPTDAVKADMTITLVTGVTTTAAPSH